MEVRFDGHCFGCGPLNEEGFRLVFEPGPDGSSVEFEVPERYKSCAVIAHCGIIALLLAEAVGWAAWHAGHPGVTGRLQVSYRRPMKIGEKVRVVGKVERIRRTLVYANSFVDSLSDGGRIADATATLMAGPVSVDVGC
jgi:acyl-coenzyme A thioesterase PaaI-like protein